MFKLTDKQKEAQSLLASPAKDIMLFGGSRSGKTFLLCRAIAIRAIKASSSRHALLRYRFNHIKASIILDTWPKMMKLCFPQVHYHIDKSDFYCIFDNKSEVWFGGLDDKQRTEKILGQEYATMLLNECSQIPYSSRNIALTRLAQKVKITGGSKAGQYLSLKMYYDCNPPAKSHWTYKLFVKHIDPDTGEILRNPENYISMRINPIDNKENLPDEYIQSLEDAGAKIRKRFLLGEFSDAVNNQLFSEDDFEKWRVVRSEDLVDMQRIIVAVDPSGAGDEDNTENDAIGIAVVGLGIDGNAYVLEDCTVKAGPKTWGTVATTAFERWGADKIVGESNYGGAMVEYVIKTCRARTPFTMVRASRGKVVRAEPFSSLNEQGRIRIVGFMPDLEEELACFTTYGYMGDKSPNRADAVIWALTEIFGGLVNDTRADETQIKRIREQIIEQYDVDGI